MTNVLDCPPCTGFGENSNLVNVGISNEKEELNGSSEALLGDLPKLSRSSGTYLSPQQIKQVISYSKQMSSETQGMTLE